MGTIVPGQRVSVKDYRGQTHVKRAVTAPVAGYDFEVVWVCREDEWFQSQAQIRTPEAIPWPVEDVRPLGDE